MKSNLAIAIPSYNRATILKNNLLGIIDDLIVYNIPIYISDDSTNNETELMAEELKQIHTEIYYHKNTIRLGHDANCLSTLSLPSQEYIWYLGDSMVIEKGAIKKIIEIIAKNDPDFVACNAKDRNLSINSGLYTDSHYIFETFAWHLTMSGVSIYNKRVVENNANLNLNLYKNFPQTAIIFNQLATSNKGLYWVNEKIISSNSLKSSYWASKVFEVFIDDFKNMISNLPKFYSDEIKDKAILSHSNNTNIFNYKSFIFYRSEGFYNYKIYLKYKNDFKKYTRANTTILIIISLLWSNPLKKIYSIIKKNKKY